MCWNCPKRPILTYFFNTRRPSWFFSKFPKDVHQPHVVLDNVLKFQKDPTSHLWDLKPDTLTHGQKDGHTDGRYSYIPLWVLPDPRGIITWIVTLTYCWPLISISSRLRQFWRRYNIKCAEIAQKGQFWPIFSTPGRHLEFFQNSKKTCIVCAGYLMMS